jgi:hypothetical protein
VADLFISYSRIDSIRVDSLARALSDSKWSIWWDRNIQPGAYWDNEVQDQLNKARCIIVVWSHDSVTSQDVNDEARFALEKNKLIPIAIDDVDLPLSFGRIQHLRLDISEPLSENPKFLELLQWIRLKLDAPPAKAAQFLKSNHVLNPPQLPLQPKEQSSRPIPTETQTDLGKVSKRTVPAWRSLSSFKRRVTIGVLFLTLTTLTSFVSHRILLKLRATEGLLELGVKVNRSDGLLTLECPATKLLEAAKFANDLGVTALHITRPGSSIEAIRNYTDLEAVNFAGTDVSDIEPLREFPNLKILNFSGTKVAQIDALRLHHKLEYLDISHTKVNDLEPLHDSTELEYLDVSGTTVSDLRVIRSLTSLKSLNFTLTNVIELEPLSRLRSIEALTFDYTEVDNLEPLRYLSTLKGLSLSCTNVRDIVPLSELRQLEKLDLSRNRLQNVDPLAMLTSVTAPNLFCTPFEDHLVAEFRSVASEILPLKTETLEACFRCPRMQSRTLSRPHAGR